MVAIVTGAVAIIVLAAALRRERERPAATSRSSGTGDSSCCRSLQHRPSSRNPHPRPMQLPLLRH